MKKIKIGSYQKYIEMTYIDEMDIYPLTLVRKANNSTANIISPTASVTAQSCKISFKPKPDQSDVMASANNPINQQINVFCSPIVPVKKGDKLVLRKMNEDGVTVMATYSGNTNNNPKMFQGHQELLFTILGDA